MKYFFVLFIFCWYDVVAQSNYAMPTTINGVATQWTPTILPQPQLQPTTDPYGTTDLNGYTTAGQIQLGYKSIAEYENDTTLFQTKALTNAQLGYYKTIDDFNADTTLFNSKALTLAQLDYKAAIESPDFTGFPLVPTAAAGTNTRQAASTAFVTSAITAANTTASNGVTKTGNNITLGGALTQNTSLTGAFNLALTQGKLGVGVVTPLDLIHVEGVASAVYNRYTNTATGNTATDGTRIGTNATGTTEITQFEALPITLSTTATERMRIDAAGNVGIGINLPTSTLHVIGSQSLSFLRVTANTTLNVTHHTIACGNGITAITVTFPNANTCSGRIYIVKRDAASTGAVTINGGGSQIQAVNGVFGATTTLAALGNYGQHKHFQSDGISWHFIN